jgi:5-methylcytosine-specific restriction endonuclease McrA
VDHIIELKDGGAPLSEDNAMSLCARCHNQKTADEKRKRAGNRQKSTSDNRSTSVKES